jgi:ankyrin repeat protein
MLQKAVGSGSAELVKYLLSFTKAQSIPYEKLVYRDSICAAIGSNDGLAVFKELLAVKPDIIDVNMGHIGTPLTQSIGGGRNAPRYSDEREILIKFLLENGADPKRMTGQPLTYLTNAVRQASLGSIELLIKHGARVEQSGAIHTAAEEGRLNAITFLLEHGADVNEQLTGNIRYSASYRARRKKEKGIISDVIDDICNSGRRIKDYVVTSDVPDYGKREWSCETPLHHSVLNGQIEATKWLVQHSANADIEDSKGWNAKGMVTKIGDKELHGLFAAPNRNERSI